MDKQKIPERLRTEFNEIPGRSRFCPDETGLSNYFEGGSSTEANDQVGRHVAECRRCQAAIGMLERGEELPENDDTPGALLAEAKALGSQSGYRRRRQLAPWAAAATLVLAVFVAFNASQKTGPGSMRDAALETNEFREVRSLDRKVLSPSITAPKAGSLVSPDAFTISWTPVNGALHYDVRVLDTDGFVVWRKRSESTGLTVPSETRLLGGAEYYVRVDAYLAEANSLSSRHVPVTIQGAER